jgi:hypothetical protein
MLTLRGLVVGLAIVLTPLAAPIDLGAQEAGDGAWEPTGLGEPVTRLYAPASGALFARTAGGLTRSDDGSTTWAAVALPAAPDERPGAVVVDPTSHATIYAVAEDGIHKTSDDAASWALIRPTEADAPTVLALAVSPADSNLLYLAVSGPRGNHFRFVRSGDGGATWDQLEDQVISTTFACDWIVPLLQPHPTDPNRVFRATSCRTNADNAVLQQSTDRGATWSDVYRPQLAVPRWLLGGQGGAPGRLYLGLVKDYRGGGSLVARSENDGIDWATMLEFSGGSASGGGPNVTVGGLAHDTTMPDRLYVGLNRAQGAGILPSQVRRSTDGGATWADLGPPQLGPIRDLTLGVDDQTLYVATDQGVWRSRVGAAP